MTHFGMFCPAASGHLNPMMALGRELKERGHRVTLIGVLDARPQVLTAGLEFQPMGEVPFPLGSAANSYAELGQLSGFAAFQYTIRLLQQITENLLQEAPSAVQRAGIEMLIIDQTVFAGSTVAERLDIPFVSVCCALMLNHDPNVPPVNTMWGYHPSQWARLRNHAGNALVRLVGRSITGLIAGYRQKWNLPPLKDINSGYSQLAQLCQQPAEFEFPRQTLPDCFHFTGPYSNPANREPVSFPFEKLTGQPLIYASLGTVQNRLSGTFRLIAEACQHLDAQLVIALGGGSTPESLPPLPGSPIVVGFAPQLELLQRATLTITHAGMNTALESLSNAVPMVAIPIANDQPAVAARIAWTGTGEVVPLNRLTVSNLRRSVERVLTQDSYKNNALRLQNAIQKAGGVKRAADIIEQVAATGKAVRSNRDKVAQIT